MLRIVLVIVMAVAITMVHSQEPSLPIVCFLDTDCQVPDTTATCVDNACDCSGTQTDAGCQTSEAEGAAGTCNPACNAEGFYACDNNVCICDVDHIKLVENDCSERRVQAECLDDRANFKIYAHTGFTGKFYFFDTTGVADEDTTPLTSTPACAFTPPGSGTSDPYRFDNYLYDSTGGDDNQPFTECIDPVNTAESGANPSHKLQFRIYVQYKSDFISEFDRIIKISCEGNPTPTNTIVPVYSGSTPIATITPTAGDIITEDLSTGITLKLTKPDGTTALDNPTSVGMPVLATITAPNVFPNVALKSLIVGTYDFSQHNTAPNNEQPVSLVTDGCSSNGLSGIVTGSTKELSQATIDTNGFSMSLTFKAFIPTDAGTAHTASKPIYIQADVCQGDFSAGTDCAQTTACNANDHLFGAGFVNFFAALTSRRRRDADIRSGEVVSLLVNITVGQPSISRERSHEMPQSEQCYTTLAFILPLVMMAVLLLLALIMVYVFFTKLSHARNGGMNGETNMAYKS